MSCTRRGFLKTVGAAMVGLGITRLDSLRSLAAGSTGGATEGIAGGPVEGPFGIDALRARAVDAARYAGDDGLAAELKEVCCWAPAAALIRQRPLDVQQRGAEYFFRDFPGGDQLSDVLLHTNNTAWRSPMFRFDPDSLVSRHYELLQKSQTGVRTIVLTPDRMNGAGARGDLGLMLDRTTGEQLAAAADRAAPMWAGLSIFSGMMLDPTDDLSSRLTPVLSLNRAHDRAIARTAAVRYSQIVLGAVQRAVYADLLDGRNAALPLVQLSASGFLPLGEEDGRFLLLRVGGSHVTGYRTGSV
jgi:hypothetical protein